MNFKRIMEHYKEEMNSEVLWDIMLISKTDRQKRAVVRELTERYWGADPFLFEHDGKTYLFYEQYDRKCKKGLIAYRTVEDDLSCSAPQIALEEDFHLSFPCVFTYQRNIYMIPETSAAGQIRLYKAVNFPSEWMFEKTIISDFPAVDTIVFRATEQGVILHTSLGDSCNVENYIIECDPAFEGSKTYKIKDFSERGNRNAGQIIRCDSETIRVGQDCSGKVYGKGLVVYRQTADGNETEIVTISHTTFPGLDDKYCGIHTYNELSEMAVVDLKYTIKKPLYKRIGFLLGKGYNAVKRKAQRRK